MHSKASKRKELLSFLLYAFRVLCAGREGTLKAAHTAGAALSFIFDFNKLLSFPSLRIQAAHRIQEEIRVSFICTAFFLYLLKGKDNKNILTSKVTSIFLLSRKKCELIQK